LDSASCYIVPLSPHLSTVHHRAAAPQRANHSPRDLFRIQHGHGLRGAPGCGAAEGRLRYARFGGRGGSACGDRLHEWPLSAGAGGPPPCARRGTLPPLRGPADIVHSAAAGRVAPHLGCGWGVPQRAHLVVPRGPKVQSMAGRWTHVRDSRQPSERHDSRARQSEQRHRSSVMHDLRGRAPL
jgi:hypothetical protein